MSEKSESKFPLKEVLVGAAAIGGVVTIGYTIYSYFVGPQNVILGTYKWLLKDIIEEEKTFVTENSRLNPPITGLQPYQENILDNKRKMLAEIQPQVNNILESRNININDWYDKALITAIAGVFIVTAPKIITKLREWRRFTNNDAMFNSYNSHYHLLGEFTVTHFAEMGNLAQASALHNSFGQYFSNVTAPALQAEIISYQSQLALLTPGTIQYIVVQMMLQMFTVEASATMGIRALMLPYWIPI